MRPVSLAFLTALCASSLAPFSLARQAGESELQQFLSNGGLEEYSFGASLAVHDTRVLIGSYSADVGFEDSGQAYLFDITTGQLLEVLRPDDLEAGAVFGASLDMNESFIAIGAPYSSSPGRSAVYVYDAVSLDLLWKLVPSNSPLSTDFGEALDLDGSTLLIGDAEQSDQGLFSGAAYLFDAQTGAELAKLLPSDGAMLLSFGRRVALDGTRAVVSTWKSNTPGVVYVFEDGVETWRLTPPAGAHGDAFGQALGLTGDKLLVGAPGTNSNGNDSGAVFVFDPATGALLDTWLPPDNQARHEFGASLAVDGSRVMIGAPVSFVGTGPGSAYLFELATGAPLAKFQSSGDRDQGRLGSAVGLGTHWATAAATLQMDSKGAAYAYSRQGLGLAYCPATENSTGFPAHLRANGNLSLRANDLSLTVYPVPNSFCLFFAGDTQVQAPFGNGLRCVGGAVQRLVLTHAEEHHATGVIAPSTAALAPGSAYVQCWYRDASAGGASFNLSSAIELTLVP